MRIMLIVEDRSKNKTDIAYATVDSKVLKSLKESILNRHENADSSNPRNDA